MPVKIYDSRYRYSTNHFLGAEMENDEGDPDDAGSVHSKANELGFVEVLGQVARLERVQRAHGNQQQIKPERHEHSHVRVLSTRQLCDVHGRMDLCRVCHRVDDRRYWHHYDLGQYNDSGDYHLQRDRTTTLRKLCQLKVVRGSNFFNPTQPTKRKTQFNPTHRKVKTLDSHTNPTNKATTHNPIEFHTTNNKPSGTRKTILIYHSQWKFVRYYSFISIYHYQVVRYYFSSHNRPTKFYNFLKMFLTHDPTRPTKS